MKNTFKHFQTLSNTFKHALTALFVFSFSNVFSQSPVISIENCFQKFQIEMGQEYNMLRGTMNLSHVGTSGPDAIIVKEYTNNGGSWQYLDYNFHFPALYAAYSDVFYYENNGQGAILVDSSYSKQMSLWNNGVFAAGSGFTLSQNVEYVEIWFTYNHPDPSNPSYSATPVPIRINFFDPSDAFTVINTSSYSCLNYNDFQINLEHDLDGFCGSFDNIKLSKHPSDITNPSDPNNTRDIALNNQISLGDWGEYCLGQTWTANPNLPNPVPAGCKTYILSFDLWPCSDKYLTPECPVINVEKEVKICCDCDVREPAYND